MEVAIPTQAMDFDFNNSMSAMSSPYSTAPPSPKRFGEYYFSAPTSPSRVSDFYRDFEEFSAGECGNNNGGYGSRSPPKVPFQWEENPGTPKKRCVLEEDGDFAFDFSEDLERTSLSADELFDGGKIKPLKTPPRLQFVEKVNQQGSSSSSSSIGQDSTNKKKTANERGRERNSSSSMGDLSSYSRSGRRATRSLSPLRVSQSTWEEEDQRQPMNKNDNNNNNNKERISLVSKPSSSSTTTNNVPKVSSSSSSSSSSSKKWRFRDFLLFRSASEGRASEKDPLKKYYMKKQEDLKNASCRSTDSIGSSARRKGPVSAHELHYTVNKAVSEDLKKKTFLPYKQGILGRLAFNPALHALANGFGSLTRA